MIHIASIVVEIVRHLGTLLEASSHHDQQRVALTLRRIANLCSAAEHQISFRVIDRTTEDEEGL